VCGKRGKKFSCSGGFLGNREKKSTRDGVVNVTAASSGEGMSSCSKNGGGRGGWSIRRKYSD